MDFFQLIDYDEWANQNILPAIREAELTEQQSEVMQLFAHLLAAQKIWMSRITGITPEIDIWPDLSLSEMETLVNENPKNLKALVSNNEEVISYQNSKGKVFKNTVQEIIMHLVIHGQHHRAQIAKLLRQSGATPPGTDFIFFLRTLDN